MRPRRSRFLTKFINEIREISGHANEPRTLRVADFLLLTFFSLSVLSPATLFSFDVCVCVRVFFFVNFIFSFAGARVHVGGAYD